MDFGNARKIFADHVFVLLRFGAQFVKVDLLKEVSVFGGPLVALGIARVIKAGALSIPVQAAAGGGKVYARHAIGELLAGGDFEDASLAVLRSVFRHCGSDEFPAHRGYGKV